MVLGKLPASVLNEHFRTGKKTSLHRAASPVE
jgi:hypothetical protein